MPKKPVAAPAPIELNVRFTLSQQLTRDILSIAAQGGINYWADGLKHKFSAESCEFRVVEQEPSTDDAPLSFDITAETVQKGIETMFQKAIKNHLTSTSPEILSCILRALVEDDASYIDADAADAIIQFGCFGELVYG